MEIQKTSGIVLATRSLGEADISCSILTRDYGKRQFIFKGLKKSRKRPLSAKEPGTNISLVYYYHPEKNRCIINECSIIDAYPVIHQSLEKIYHLTFILEAVEKTSAEGTGDTRMYYLLEGAIKYLSSSVEIVHLSAFFIIHLLRMLGLFPAYGTCSSCSREIGGGFYLSTHDLSQTCLRCADGRNGSGEMKNARAHYLGSTVHLFISRSFSTKFGEMDYSCYDEGELKALIRSLGRFIEEYFHIKLHTLNFIVPDTVI